jgi:hypothetical protein
MSALRQKMIEDMQLKGWVVRTREAYVNAVLQLSRRYKKLPDCIEEEELREYFLYLKNEKRVADSTFTIALCGIKFCYEQTLKKEWHSLQLVRPDTSVHPLQNPLSALPRGLSPKADPFPPASARQSPSTISPPV